MTTATLAKMPRIPAGALPLYRFSVKQYDNLIASGIIASGQRVELLEGWLVEKVAYNPPHDGTICRVERRLARVLPEQWLIRVQSAVTLDDSKPEPDLAVVRGPEEKYFLRHPVPKDIGLAIEVSDSILEQDRSVKGPLYARNRLPIYWIIDLANATLEVYMQPRAGRNPTYRQHNIYTKAASVPLILAGQELAIIPVRELLP
jgi:hypothetical protein